MAGIRVFLTALVALAFACGAAISAERAIIVLDGSGSMWAQVGGKARIVIARETLDTVLAELPADLELGLMSYGHREKGNCADIEMLVPAGADTADRISAAAHKINPKGMTPLSDAVRKAAEALRYTEDRATVILITDGLETCDADPCALGAELEAQGIDFTVNVLGFGLSDEEGQQIACLAENTGGKYLSAQDGDALVAALTETVAEAAAEVPPPPPAKPDHNVMPTISLAEGQPDFENDVVLFEIFGRNADGSRGKSVTAGYGSDFKADVTPGAYVMVAKLGEAVQEQAFDVDENEVATPHFVMNAGFLSAVARLGEDEPPAEARFDVSRGDEEWAYYNKLDSFYPAGELDVRIKIGSAEMDETVTIVAGERLEKDFVLAAGVAAITAVYTEDMPVEDDGLSVEILSAKKDIQGKRTSIDHAYGHAPVFSLNAGDYVAVAKLGDTRAEVPFTVSAAARTEPVIDFNAGVLAVSSPGVPDIIIYTAEPDLQGKRKTVSYSYEEESQFVLPAGEYVVETRPDAGEGQSAKVSISAGKRSEIAFE